MAAIVFVTLRTRHGEFVAPQFRNVFECSWADAIQHSVGDADRGDRNFAAISATWHQQMSGLLAKKGNGVFGLDRRAHHRAGRAIDPAWKINGDDGCRLSVRSLDDRLGQPADWTV